MNFFLQLFKYVGAFAAIIICVGFLSKSGETILGSPEDGDIAQAGLFDTNGNASPGSDMGLAASRPNEGRIPARYESSGEPSLASMDAMPVSSEQVRGSNSSRGKKSFSARELDDWVQMNAAQTYLEAEKETMSPGVILATGIYFLQQGQGDMSMTAADIAAYLTDVKNHASAEAKSYMKYIANSESWCKGLNIAGFDGDKIEAIFNTHRLSVYDKQMYNRHVQRKMENPGSSIASETLSEDKATGNRRLADAYNEYLNRPEAQEKYSLPTRTGAKKMTEAEVSAGRKEAQSYRVGQSKTYDDPAEFWAVLQEMIALEEGYDSWSAYKAADARSADNAFQDRSNLMALGGVMKVTRK